VVVRSGFDEMKASPWEKEDALREDIAILNYLAPKAFLHEHGRLTGMVFQRVRAEYDQRGRRQLVPTGEPDVRMEADDILVAVGQENAFTWIEPESGVEFLPSGLPVLDEITLQSTNPRVFFGGDAAFGPKNIIWGVAHGHAAAISIDRFCHGENVRDRLPPDVTLFSEKMGIHEWSYDNAVSIDLRYKVPHREKALALSNIGAEVELGFDEALAFKEAQRCLNCDVQTVFTPKLCIECDACVDICPTDCITFTANGEEAALRGRLTAPSHDVTQDIYVADGLKTGRIMVKDENVCLHCGMCAERCPTGAWDMQRFLFDLAQVGARKAAHACTR
jgi:ferredoxin